MGRHASSAFRDDQRPGEPLGFTLLVEGADNQPEAPRHAGKYCPRLRSRLAGDAFNT